MSTKFPNILRQMGIGLILSMPLLLAEMGQATPLLLLPHAPSSSSETSGPKSSLNPPLFSADTTSGTLPTANFVSQPVLDAVNQLRIATTPPFPSLGQADKFLPAQDAFAPLRLVLKLSERRVYIYHEEQVKTSFPVAIGRSGWETPTGRYSVIQMQHDPVWQHPFTGELVPPGSANPLGARWIGFWTDGTNYIGFHGTPNEESVGQPASHGCVRMYNRDVVQLFEMVRIGTTVEVVP